MTFEEFQEITNNISYREGFKISSYLDSHKKHRFHLMWDTRCVNTGKIQPLVIPFNVDYNIHNESEIVHFILRVIQSGELHESLEFFNYHNQRIFDPHRFKTPVQGWREYEQTRRV